MVNPKNMTDKDLLDELKEYGASGQRNTETLYHHSSTSNKKGGTRNNVDKDKTGKRWHALIAEAENRKLI